MSTGIDYQTLLLMIDSDQAIQEIMSHLCFEVFLSLYGPVEVSNQYVPRSVDFRPLYDYCDQFFNKYSLEEALVNCYFFRFYHNKGAEGLLLSNSRLIPLLDAAHDLNKEQTEVKNATYNERINMVSWEIFRQILSPYLDEIDKEIRADVTSDLIINHNEEVIKLKNKCWKLAEDFKGEKDIETLVENISKYVAIHVESDIQLLLKLDNKTFKNIRDKIFADPKSWMGLGATICSVYADAPIISIGASLGLFSSLLAKSFQTSQENKKAISQSEYALIHKIKKP